MRVAMTVWGNRVSPVFDSAQTILMAEIDNQGDIVDQGYEFIPGQIPTQLARLLVEKQVETLICGAISDAPANIIENAGIRLIPFVTGNANQLLSLYATGGSLENFMMPGCGNKGRPGCCSGQQLREQTMTKQSESK